MAEGLPAIRLTDPQSRDQAPSLPTSPLKANGEWDGDFRRPGTPVSRHAAAREGKSISPAANNTTSPSKIIRTLSNNVANQIGAQASSKDESPPIPSVSPSIDPLSQQILKRTNAPQNSRPILQHGQSSEASILSDEKSFDERRQSTARTSTGLSRSDSTARLGKEKKKGVSFLSRIIGNKKKEVDEAAPDDVSETSEVRPEGAEAEVFQTPVDRMGFHPRHPQPPAYIKVRTRYKKEKNFDRLFLAQELDPSVGKLQGNGQLRRKSSTTVEPKTIWSMEWSKDGKYLATAGHDKKVRVWAVLSAAEQRQTEQLSGIPDEGYSASLRVSAPVFQPKPIREYDGHSSTVLDLAWSKNNFLLSSSMDKTVKLWHVSREECLCTFKHNDFVPSISFHPKDDRFFLAGSLDCKLRLWSIPDKSVAYWTQLPDMITAVAFTPDGKSVIAGCLSGLCMFYETEGLKYQTQIVVRSAHGKNAKGSKITGIVTQNHPHGSVNGDVRMLISSNDSRIRLYNLRDKSLDIKFKGNQNQSSQIRAAVSDDLRFVCCGSEDRRAYIWSIDAPATERRDKNPVEMFDAHNSVTTCVTFAPTKTKQLLGRSEDPIYDLCNPPPVMLLSRSEKAASRSSSRAPTEAADSAQHSPTEANNPKTQKPPESAAQTARSTHRGGDIIVTADFSGRIKVFRQDCAWAKRRADMETSSNFRKRMGSKVSRTASLRTKTSNRSLNSTRESIASTQAPSERILSWRQGISSSPNVAGSASTRKGSRSISPRKSMGQASLRSNQVKPESSTPPSAAATPGNGNGGPSPALSRAGSNASSVIINEKARNQRERQRELETTVLDRWKDDPLSMQGAQSNLFWTSHLQKIRAGAERAREMTSHKKRDSVEQQRQGGNNGSMAEHNDGGHGHGLAVPGEMSRNGSFVSQLSTDRSSGEDDDDQDDRSSGKGRKGKR